MTENKTTSQDKINHIDRTLYPEKAEDSVITEQNLVQHTVGYSQSENIPKGICPNCGAEIDVDMDYCESCNSYIKNDICPFCGSHTSSDAVYCPECGNPRMGIACPVCHTVNEFSFCKQCGTALTDEAKVLVTEFRNNKDYMHIQNVVHEFAEVDNILPYILGSDKEKEQQIEDLRIRVLTILAHDQGSEPKVEKIESKRMTVDELEKRRADVVGRLTTMLERLETKPTGWPEKARNYIMASKPAGVKLAWVCNYKHAMHSSPCGCAKPHLGGKWVILDNVNVDQIKDDR